MDRTHHYVAPPPTRCHACTAVHLRTPDYEDRPAPEALRFRADRIDDHPHEPPGGHPAR